MLSLLAAMIITAGQAWANTPDPVVQFGHITYNGTAANDGGTLQFYGNSSNLFESGQALTSDNLYPIYEDPTHENNNYTILGYRFYIRAIPNMGRKLVAPDADGNVSFIRAELVSTGPDAQQAPRRSPGDETFATTGQTLPVKFQEYGTFYEIISNETVYKHFGLYYVEMPANPDLSVSITATFPEQATNTEAVSYIDADGVEQTKAAGTVYVLDGTEGRIGYRNIDDSSVETWYVCNSNSNLSYINSLRLLGTVNLILADNSSMTVGSANNPTSAPAIYAQSENVNFYGQNAGTGSLDVYGNNGIWASNVTINGGRISATGSLSYGIYGYITINGGQVTANGARNGIYGDSGITINGGQVTANGGTGETVENACGILGYYGDIILGWKNSDDFITANSYKVYNGTSGNYVMKTATDKILIYKDGTEYKKVMDTVSDVTTIAGKTLRPNILSGYCGKDDATTTDVDESKNLAWQLVYGETDNTLTITGNGAMADYSATASPWDDHSSSIDKAVIQTTNGVTVSTEQSTGYFKQNATATLEYTGTAAENHTFNGYFVHKADRTNISATAMSYDGTNNVWTLTMPDCSVTVSPKLTRNTTVSVAAYDIPAGDDARVIVNVEPVGETDDPVSGITTISVTEGSKTTDYNVAVVDGTGDFNVTNLANGSYTITASFAANDQWSASQAAAPVELYVPMVATSLGISLDKTEIYVDETATVSIQLDKSMNAVVTARRVNHGEEFTVNTNLRNSDVALVNGMGKLELSGFDAGIYDIRVEYAGDEKYVESTSNVLTLTVSKRETSVSVSTNSSVIAK